MAIWNEILEGGLNQLLAKRLGMQTGSPTPAISPELTASLTLENDRPEWGYLKGEVLAGARGSQAGVAGQNTWLSLANPTGSGVIITIEKVIVNVGASFIFFKLRNQPNAAGTVSTTSVRDVRWIPQGVVGARSAAVYTMGTIIGLAPEAAYESFAGNGTHVSTTPVILRPGTQLHVECVTVAVSMADTTIAWRERAAAPGELGL